MPWLDAAALKREVAASAGLADFGADPFAENYARFVDSLNRDGRLTEEGAALTRAEILRLLRNRLEIASWLAREPAILEEKIAAPIFLMGLPRSGTTFLHHLFDHDSRLRLLRTWQTLRPCPPPATDPDSVAARLEAARAFVGQWQTDVVDFDATHLLDADGPDECALILNIAFGEAGFQNYLRVPGYFDWLCDSGDLLGIYRFHKTVLQLLQWRDRPRRWVVKYPNHLLAMAEIRQLHPEAVFVVSHRDPVQTLASLCDLTYQYRAPRTAGNDRAEIGREMWRFVGEHVDRLLAFRASGGTDRVHDVDYYRLVADPVGTVEAVYRAVDMDMQDDVRERLADWTLRNPKGKRGAHLYRLEDYGLDFDRVDARFADYRRRYAIPLEYA